MTRQLARTTPSRRRTAVVRCSLALMGVVALAVAAVGDDWPQWRGPRGDGIWREDGLVEMLPGPELPLRWKVPIGLGYSGPSVAEERVYAADRVTEPVEQERIHAFDWKTGRKLWTHAYECSYREVGEPKDGPRAALTIADGRLYSLGATGAFRCLDTATGRPLWYHDLAATYRIRLPTWGLAVPPLIEEDLVIVEIGGEGACLVAFDRRTGRERWRALNDLPAYAPMVVTEQAGRRVLIAWLAERVVGLDPRSGGIYWQHPFPYVQNVGFAHTPVVEGERLFLSGYTEGSLMLRLPRDRLAVEKLWQRRGQNIRNTDGLHVMMGTPLLLGDYLYGFDAYGELRCLDARTGDRLWESTAVMPRGQWATAHMVRNRDRVWIFNEKGELIIARLSPQGYRESSRARLIRPTLGQLPDRRRGGVCWSHPAFAYRHVFVRNDEELVCASLAAR